MSSQTAQREHAHGVDMVSATAIDPRIKELRIAVQLMRMGNFELKLSQDGEDEVSRLSREIVALAQDMKERITRDPVTKLLSRVTTVEVLDKELDRKRRSGGSIAVMMANVDRFGSITDTFGFAAGDAVLREISNRISLNVRGYDHVGRYDNNEFLIVLTDVDPMYCQSATDRIHTSIRDRRFRISGQDVVVTMSIGVVVIDKIREMTTLEIIARASEALSAAKNGGRDRIEIREINQE